MNSRSRSITTEEIDSKSEQDQERLARLDIIGRLMRLLDRSVPPIAAAASRIRDKILSLFELSFPFPLVRSPNPYLTHILSVVISGVLLVVVLSTSGLNLFAFHPVCMTLGCVLLMSEGFLVYRNGTLVNCLSPIMGGSQRSNSRSIHVFLQASGACFMLAGFVFIAANKVRLGKSTLPASVHAWVGALALLAVSVQSVVGSAKATSSTPVHRWHGSAGKLTYDLCMAAVCSGAAAFLPVTPVNVGVLLGLGVLWVSTQLQHSMGERKSGDGQSGSGGLGSSAHGLLTADKSASRESDSSGLASFTGHDQEGAVSLDIPEPT